MYLETVLMEMVDTTFDVLMFDVFRYFTTITDYFNNQ